MKPLWRSGAASNCKRDGCGPFLFFLLFLLIIKVVVVVGFFLKREVNNYILNVLRSFVSLFVHDKRGFSCESTNFGISE